MVCSDASASHARVYVYVSVCVCLYNCIAPRRGRQVREKYGLEQLDSLPHAFSGVRVMLNSLPGFDFLRMINPQHEVLGPFIPSQA